MIGLSNHGINVNEVCVCFITNSVSQDLFVFHQKSLTVDTWCGYLQCNLSARLHAAKPSGYSHSTDC